MNVSVVTSGNITCIKALADSLQVTDASQSYGFYRYSLTANQYSRRINPFFTRVTGHMLEGFCLAYDDELLRSLFRKELVLQHDSITKWLLQKEDFVYLDQLAVRFPGTMKGARVANVLYENLLQTVESEYGVLFGAIPHHPWKNTRSVNFALRNGCTVVDEVNKNGIVLGMYELKL